MSIVITVEYADPEKPGKSITCDIEEAVSGMRDLAFRVAVGEYRAVYMTSANPLRKIIKQEAPDGNER